jgi:hypothetical protein
MADDEGVLCLIATYNTNLQGNRGLPQDLVDWLTPTLHVSKFLGDTHKKKRRAADLVAVGFQELLPLHLGCWSSLFCNKCWTDLRLKKFPVAGLSQQVMQKRTSLILSEIEKHNDGARYTLVGSVVYVGVALLVYARCDDEDGHPSMDRLRTVLPGQ